MKQVIDEAFLSQLELFSLAVKDNVAGLFGGNHKSKKYGSSCEFADYREYMEGDDITKIDWNLYGKFEKMYLKLYLDERQMRTRIYIDASTSMSFGGKDEMAVKLATALTYLSVSEMDKVNVYYLKNGHAEPIIESLVGRDSFFNEIGRMNTITFDGVCTIRDAIVNSVVGYGDGRSVIISDFETEGDYTSAIDYLREKRRDVLCLQVLSEEELHPAFRGKTVIHDSEDLNRTYKDTINRDLLKAYQQALDQVTHRISDYCQARDADYLLVSTADSMKDIFLGKLAQRGVIS